MTGGDKRMEVEKGFDIDSESTIWERHRDLMASFLHGLS